MIDYGVVMHESCMSIASQGTTPLSRISIWYKVCMSVERVQCINTCAICKSVSRDS